VQADRVTVSTMASRAARLMTIAAAAIFAGCGGGSSTKTAITSTAPGGLVGSGQLVTAKNGAFSTVVPAAYTYTPTAAQFVTRGPEEGGSAPVIAVIRQPASEGDVATVARETLRAVKRPPKPAQQASALRSSSVAGEVASAFDYVVAGAPGHSQHVIIVLVRHREWVYSVRAASSSTQYQALNRALEEVIGKWRWL
jgi:hypothetical protein